MKDTNDLAQRTEQADIARIRALCRQGFEEATPHIIAIAKGEIEGTTPATQARAQQILAQYAQILPAHPIRPGRIHLN